MGDVARDLGRAAGSVRTGISHSVVEPGKLAAQQHCHSAEEEIYVLLEGDGTLLLGDDESPVRAGPCDRPACRDRRRPRAPRRVTGGLTYLAYGTREPNDIAYYPHSNKVNFRGIKLIARVERLDYWDGED